jgi:hypothetical protein
VAANDQELEHRALTLPSLPVGMRLRIANGTLVTSRGSLAAGSAGVNLAVQRTRA